MLNTHGVDMTFTIPGPDVVYQSDNLYEVRFESAVKYISAQLTTPESVHLLRMIEDKPTYVVEYNLGDPNPHKVPLANVDNEMAQRIVEAFKHAGWANCYWQEFNECDPVLPLGNWGYRFYFERPIETVPYEVLRRISKKEIGDLPLPADIKDNECVPVSIDELTKVINAQMPIRDQPRRLDGALLDVIKDTQAKRYGYTGTGYYVGNTGELAVVLEMGPLQIYYCRHTRNLYHRNKGINSDWAPVEVAITLAPKVILSALKDLEVFNASV